MSKILTLTIALLLLAAIYTTVAHASPSGSWGDGYGTTVAAAYFSASSLSGYTLYEGNALTTYNGGTPFLIEASAETWNTCGSYHYIDRVYRADNFRTQIRATTLAGTTQCGRHTIEVRGNHGTRRTAVNGIVGGSTVATRTIP